jgi:hypothetical protein
MECAEAEQVSPQAMNGKYGSMVRKIFEDSKDFRGFKRNSACSNISRFMFKHDDVRPAKVFPAKYSHSLGTPEFQ